MMRRFPEGSQLALMMGLAALLGAGAPSSTVMAQAKARLIVGSIAIGQGSTGTVAVTGEDVSDLYGAEIRLSFDPAVVEVVDIDPAKDGVQVGPGGFLDKGFVATNTADNAKGTVWYAATQLNPSEPKSGQGEILIVTFRGRKAGARSDVAIRSATLANRSGEVIPATLVGGEVRVLQAGQAPATPTRDPAAQPTLAVPPGAPGRSAARPPGATQVGDRGEPTAVVPAVASPAPATGMAVTGTVEATRGATPMAPTEGSPIAAPQTATDLGQAPTTPGTETGTTSGQVPPATLTVSVPIATHQAVPESSQPSDGGRGGPWAWVVGLAVLLGLVYALFRARRPG
jgi:hypothetical protein